MNSDLDGLTPANHLVDEVMAPALVAIRRPHREQSRVHDCGPGNHLPQLLGAVAEKIDPAVSVPPWP